MSMIIQWNCRGFRGNYEDVRTLIKDFNPAVICLQETMHGDTVPCIPRGYRSFLGAPETPVLGCGAITLVRNDHAAYQMNVNTTLKVVVVRVDLSQTYTLCNIYIEPNAQLDVVTLETLMQQLPAPFVIAGDVNCRSPVWGDGETNTNGRVMEQVLLRNNAVVLNNGRPTHITLHTGAESCLDLGLCSPATAAQLEWNVVEEVHGSDHYPVTIKETLAEEQAKPVRYITEKANWRDFRALTYIPLDAPQQNIDEMVAYLSGVIAEAANIAIPQTSSRVRSKTVPWWNEDCELTRRRKKQALRQYQRTRTGADLIALKRARAVARRTQRLARRESWTRYISTVNKDTPINKIYNKIKKIQGRYSFGVTPYLDHNGQKVLHSGEVADIFGHHFAEVSSNNNYEQGFMGIKAAAERL